MSEKLKSKIFSAIKESAEVKEENYISVNIKSKGFMGMGKKQIELTGRAKSEKDKAKIEEISREHAGDLEIISTIRVGRSG